MSDALERLKRWDAIVGVDEAVARAVAEEREQRFHQGNGAGAHAGEGVGFGGIVETDGGGGDGFLADTEGGIHVMGSEHQAGASAVVDEGGGVVVRQLSGPEHGDGPLDDRGT